MLKGQRIAASLLSSVVVLAITILAIAPVTLHAQPKPGHLDEVIRQMDAASKKFQAAEANFRWDLYERVVKETTTQTGTIYFKKVGTSTVMGAKITSPAVKFLEYRLMARIRVYLNRKGTNHLTTF